MQSFELHLQGSTSRSSVHLLLYDLIGSLPQHYHVSVTREAKKDLQIWQNFLTDNKYVTPFWAAIPVYNSTIKLFTDATANAELGWGAYFNGHWSHACWPTGFIKEGRSIALLEFIPIVMALELWKEQLQNKFIIFHSDNQAACHIVNNQTSRCPLIMSLVRKLVLTALHYNIIFKAKYIVGTQNEISDALSRFQLNRF